MPKITELKDSRSRTTEQGKISVTRQFVITFYTGETMTQKAADTLLNTYGYTFGSAADYSHEPGAPVATDTTVTLQTRTVTREPKAMHLFNASLAYKTYDDNPTGRAVNTEEIEVDFSTSGTTQYFGDSGGPDADFNEPLNGEKGQFGAPALLPMMIIRVKRIQSTINYAAIALAAGKVNDAAYTTPGGQLLCAVKWQLLFLGCTTRQLDDDKYELVYTFHRDIALINKDGVRSARNHRVTIVTFTEDKKAIDEANPFYVFPEADFTALMSDE